MRILLVEDNPASVRLAVEAFRSFEGPVAMELAMDGEEALQWLGRSDGEPPDLVILDLHLPRKNGHEVLAEMKADTRLCRIPVVIFSTSNAESDRRRSYALGANAYLMKPLFLDEYFAALHATARLYAHGIHRERPGNFGQSLFGGRLHSARPSIKRSD